MESLSCSILILAAILTFGATAQADHLCPKGSNLKVETATPIETGQFCEVDGQSGRYVGPFLRYTPDHAECKGVFGKDGKVLTEKCLFQDGTKKRVADSNSQKTFYRDGKLEELIIWAHGKKNGMLKEWDERGKLVRMATIIEEAVDAEGSIKNSGQGYAQENTPEIVAPGQIVR